ncbi:hypothetical protein KIN20_022523 [Parelaphostrongylus tenuis]|uniref:Uncharacterized protein n=1 Tax=Parelaphostrongylus tenuis TaxID=148309 RepID=A0AAD5QWT8_PARTN|nr:hypothetical protein KIN20_022523 [Parelaphostrongylus tenuis]
MFLPHDGERRRDLRTWTLDRKRLGWVCLVRRLTLLSLQWLSLLACLGRILGSLLQDVDFQRKRGDEQKPTMHVMDTDEWCKRHIMRSPLPSLLHPLVR